jgi:DNA-nicking Smr family endonuclease
MRGVTRLEPEAAPPAEPPPPHPEPVPRAAKAPSDHPAAGLDRRSAQRLRRGELRPEARLDLHGMTQEEAHRALAHFIARAQEDGLRALLVITGKGGGGRGGVLREAVPRWLEEPSIRGRILGVAPARPKDGGAGALYVLLRRRR